MNRIFSGMLFSLLLGSAIPLAFAGPADLDNDGVLNSYDPDMDGDGIPNVYEQYNPDLKYRLGSDGAGDLDGDGWSNAEEYRAVTDLYDPNSNPDMLTGPELQKVFGFDAPANSEFGYSVDVKGDWAVIGAPWGYTTEDPLTGRRIEPVQTGAVYLYQKKQGVWKKVHKLLPYSWETTENGDTKRIPIPEWSKFGSAVSLAVASEGWYEYPVVIGVGAAGTDKAYAFSPVDMNGPWIDAAFAFGQPFYQNSFGGSENSFGTSVSISDSYHYLEGTLIVGCPHCETEEGRVDIIKYTVYPDDPEVTSFTGCEMPFCNLGEKVILEGDTLVASAPSLMPGFETVVVFSETEGVWSRDTELTSTLTDNQDSFATSVAFSGDTVLVSDYSSAGLFGPVGNIYEFTRTDGIWTETGAIYADDLGAGGIGNALTLSGDIALTSDNLGDVISLYRSGGTWVELGRETIAPEDEDIKDFFAVDAATGNMLVGSPDDFDGGEDAGAAYFVDLNTLP